MSPTAWEAIVAAATLFFALQSVVLGFVVSTKVDIARLKERVAVLEGTNANLNAALWAAVGITVIEPVKGRDREH